MGRISYTVSVDDVKFIVCEHWENGNDSNNSNKSPRLFRLKAEVSKVDIKMNLFTFWITADCNSVVIYIRPLLIQLLLRSYVVLLTLN